MSFVHDPDAVIPLRQLEHGHDIVGCELDADCTSHEVGVLLTRPSEILFSLDRSKFAGSTFRLDGNQIMHAAGIDAT